MKSALIIECISIPLRKKFYKNTAMNTKRTLSVFLITIFISLCTFNINAQRHLMRFPDINNDFAVFVQGEDIWTVSSEGGIANRITINDGQERFPRISPDGSMIAFTGDYDGNGDIYVMNRYGGDIARVTWHPGYDQMIGWHPINNKIIFTSSRQGWPRFPRLYMINPDGTEMEELIMHDASQGSFSPDGKQIAYNRTSREFRTWKRYKGGTAQEIWLYDFASDQMKNLTNWEGTDRMPMWIKDKIYFTSDRNRTLNIYCIDPKTGETEQLTFHNDYDARRPSAGGNKIIYELGGKLMVLDVDTKQTKELTVEIKTDSPESRPYLKDVKDDVVNYNSSPAGERAVLIARGEIFTVPEKEGLTRNLSQTSGAREKDAVWSPDGKYIAYLSDISGEYEIYIIDQKGENEPVKLTTQKDGYRHSLKWSPDSKKIAFTDQTLTLFFVDIDTKKVTRVDQAYYENIDVSMDLKPIYDYSWSPDNKYIVYSKMDKDQVYKMYIYELDNKEIHGISTIFNDFHPVFTPDGKHLLFISNRRFSPTYCDFEWQLVYKKVAGIYAITLQKDGCSILPFKSDEVKVADENSEIIEEKESENTTNIDFEGIAERVEALPLPRGNYRYLSVNEDAVFFLDKAEGDFNRFEFRVPRTMDLYNFSFTDREKKKIMTAINGYKLAADGKKIIYKKGNEVGFIKATQTEPSSDGSIHPCPSCACSN